MKFIYYPIFLILYCFILLLLIGIFQEHVLDSLAYFLILYSPPLILFWIVYITVFIRMIIEKNSINKACGGYSNFLVILIAMSMSVIPLFILDDRMIFVFNAINSISGK